MHLLMNARNRQRLIPALGLLLITSLFFYLALDGVERNALASPATIKPASISSVKIDPDYREVGVGLTTAVDIHISNATNLYGAQVHVAYDPSLVQIVDTQPMTGVQVAVGDFPYPDYVGVNTADNVSGMLHLAVTQVKPRLPAQGDGVMGTITFMGVQSGTSPVTITLAHLSDPDGFELPSTVRHGEIQVAGGGTALIGEVSFQARSQLLPALSWSCPLSVALFLPGHAVPSYLFAPTTDRYGVFTVTNIVSDTYDLKVRDLHSLWNVREGYEISGVQTVDMGTLVEGDANVDGVINIYDFSLLGDAFGTSVGDPLFDPRVDFNNSMNVDILDFSLLASNYGRSGEILLSGSSSSRKKK